MNLSISQDSLALPAREQGGTALMPCAFLLLMVLLLNSASLRISRNQQNAAQVHADRSIARHAAEAALLDAEQHLMIVDDPLSPLTSGMVYQFGSITGGSYMDLADSADSGAMQSARSPSYRIDLISVAATGGICRVSATGTGLLSTTEIRLQADYAVSACDPDAGNSCTREVRRLAWRELATD